jgi:hypothetical protein
LLGASFGAGTLGAAVLGAGVPLGASLLVNALTASKQGATNTPSATQDQIIASPHRATRPNNRCRSGTGARSAFRLCGDDMAKIVHSREDRRTRRLINILQCDCGAQIWDEVSVTSLQVQAGLPRCAPDLRNQL